MIDQVLYSFHRLCPEFLGEGGKIVVACDGYKCVTDQEEGGTGKEHDETKRCYGTISEGQASRYDEFVETWRRRAENVESARASAASGAIERLASRPSSRPDSPDRQSASPKTDEAALCSRPVSAWGSQIENLSVIGGQRGAHLGFAHTLKAALDECVTTPLVMVLPHDVKFSDDFDGSKIRRAAAEILLEEQRRGWISREEGKSSDHHELLDLDSASATARPLYIGFLSGRTMNLQQRFWEKAKVKLEVAHPQAAPENPPTPSVDKLLGADTDTSFPLLPLPLWKENPHIASVRQYRELVFSGKIRRIRKGQFIEETVGQGMIESMSSSSRRTSSDGEKRGKRATPKSAAMPTTSSTSKTAAAATASPRTNSSKTAAPAAVTISPTAKSSHHQDDTPHPRQHSQSIPIDPLALHREEYGTYLLYDGCSATAHLDGRCYLPVEERLKMGWKVARDAQLVSEMEAAGWCE
ncbi:unnamed protein product [Amoebophrya sp. A25]|nr:unnamed protein product [Amoebophrya sp. A25]|eukprot:GSA25T00002700001.1